MTLEENPSLQLRRGTTKEYYHLTGSTVYSEKLREKKGIAGITAIEAATPTAKTARIFPFWRFANHMLTNMDALFSFMASVLLKIGLIYTRADKEPRR